MYLNTDSPIELPAHPKFLASYYYVHCKDGMHENWGFLAQNKYVYVLKPPRGEGFT